jgi:diguanylate cyclase (GGDEF)-like protein
MIPFSTCAIYLHDGSDRLRAVCVEGEFSELIQDSAIVIGKGISGWVSAYQRPMFNTGPSLDFQGINGDLSSFKDTLVVPIVHEDESLGTISLYAQQSSIYGPHELSILQTLAGFLAPLISESRKRQMPAADEVLDPATGLNRISYLTAIGPQLIAAAGKNRTPASLIFIDIRSLVQIARTFGAGTGSSVLKRIADIIKPELRGTDILVRFGHHGFVAFLPGVRDEQALHCAQRLKHQIKSHASSAGTQTYAIDCQTGIASYPRDGITILALLQSAQKSAASSEEVAPAQDNNIIGFPPRA